LPGDAAGAPLAGSEDCLTLNIWTPAGNTAGQPVLVWVHGGGFVRGGGANYDGAALAARVQCVVVTINYRLGPFGFLYLGHVLGNDAVNPGLLDIVAALEFVDENAAVFGGDPRRVTVFGESAGAMLIGALLAVPRAHGLFQRAVLLSGAARNVHPRARAEEIAAFFVEAAGLRPGRAADLENAPVELLCRAAAATNDASVEHPWDAEAFLPVVDGAVLPADPIGRVAAGASAGVPLLLAVCREEMNLFLAVAPSLCAGKERFGEHLFGWSRWAALQQSYLEMSPSAAEARRDLLTDSMFAIPAIRLAEAHAQAGGSSWLMRLDRGLDLPRLRALGPCHGHDVYMLWEDYAPSNGTSLATGGSAADRQAARQFQEIVARFAGDPLPSPAEWPPYIATDRKMLLLGENRQIHDDPGAARRRLWDGLLEFSRSIGQPVTAVMAC
jgi:para-nitrobenzyl esterase